MIEVKNPVPPAPAAFQEKGGNHNHPMYNSQVLYQKSKSTGLRDTTKEARKCALNKK